MTDHNNGNILKSERSETTSGVWLSAQLEKGVMNLVMRAKRESYKLLVLDVYACVVADEAAGLPHKQTHSSVWGERERARETEKGRWRD